MIIDKKIKNKNREINVICRLHSLDNFNYNKRNTLKLGVDD